MCLVLTAWNAHPVYRLVVAANRDEFYARDSTPIDWWADEPEILAGRDISPQGGGTWLGLTDGGRFSAVTNVREPERTVEGARSRGELTVSFLKGADSPRSYAESLAHVGDSYNGFNLLVADLDELWWYSNRSGEPRALDSGLHGLSNAAVDTQWPKVSNGVAGLGELLDADADVERYLELLADTTQAPDELLPTTGLPIEMERIASAAFCISPEYGTTASTVLRIRGDGAFDMTERRFNADGPIGTTELHGKFAR